MERVSATDTQACTEGAGSTAPTSTPSSAQPCSEHSTTTYSEKKVILKVQKKNKTNKTSKKKNSKLAK
jgi:hypothetical protein